MSLADDIKDSVYRSTSAPHECSTLQSAFLDGAKFWEYHQTMGTMWQSDQNIVMEEAQKRYKT